MGIWSLQSDQWTKNLYGHDDNIYHLETLQGGDYILTASGDGTVSFVYTAIHEVGHGLGFLDTFDPETGQLFNALPTASRTAAMRSTSARLRARST